MIRKRLSIVALASVVALLALSAPAQAVEGPFAIEPGSFGTEISTTQAGAHPDLRTKFKLNTNPDGSPAGGTPRNLGLIIPRGLIGAPAATPTCPISKIYADENHVSEACPMNTVVGRVALTIFYSGSFPLPLREAVFNINPYPGEPAAFAFNAVYPVRIDTYLRADGDYGVTATATELTEGASLTASDLTLWGVPADHQGPGTETDMNTARSFGAPSGAPRVPFMTNPTECSGNPLTSSISLDTWQQPVQTSSADYSLGAITGCDQLEFEPTIDAQPTTNLADAPSGLDFELHMRQNPDPDDNATARLKDATVTFPAGLSVNPASANGLGACSLAQAGISASGQSNGQPVNCPNNSKLGIVEAVSPAIGHPLPGSLYLARQNENPFGSLLALYLVIEDPLSGVLVKLAGKVEADPNSGQLTTRFAGSPDLPVEDLGLHLFQGPRAALRTPTACGTHTTTSTLTPWSSPEGADAMPTSSFALTGGPGGGPCLPDGASAPNKPTFSAGTLDPTAKAFSPFVLKLTREDGSQPITTIDATLPKGLLGKLAGIPYCPDAALAAAAANSGKAEQASSSCPSASQVGTVNVGAGAGSEPFYATGKAYLAGPYKGAPLSLAILTPAVAGPFDLGTVVVRTALDVDPESAQIHAVSDPIPTILQGIPLDVRSIALNMSRPSFTLNPTNCAPMAVLGSATSVFDQSAALSDPFQVGDCGRLGFKPQLSIKLKGGTKRSDHPALTAVLKARPNDANIATTSVALPHSEFLAQNHIRTVCTRVQFAAAAGNGAECPAGSIYGSARAFSPLLDKAVEGPVYLRSSSNPLPDLVVALHGQIDVNLVGRIDSKNGGIRTSFDSVPDAPVSKFVLEMKGGKKGLLENSRNLCKTTNKASVQMGAQSGAELVLHPVVGNSCKTKAHKTNGKKHEKRHHS
jgi:hypothetical protein